MEGGPAAGWFQSPGADAATVLPRRPAYELTPLGRSMLAPMDAACAWAREHGDELLDAREKIAAESR
ncbi:hypothetical protein [Catellatospora methionotrophica]|uniref:hypothetical protein n=1 Tax=Catellatospora methionotrophica TaxID=121620 RepID=UPI0033D7041E